MGCIYTATNRHNGKVYVGQTIQSLHKRRVQHEHASKNPYRRDRSYFHSALAKHGLDAFDWAILCTDGPDVTLDELEELAIDVNGTTVPNGYNLRPGGNSCRHSVARKRRRDEENDLPLYISMQPGGYVVSHGPSGQITCFRAANLSMAEKLALAVAWLDEAKAGKQMEKRRGRANNSVAGQQRRNEMDAYLPKNIVARRRDGVVTGYRAICAKTRRTGTFSDPSMTMAEKLQKAEQWLAAAKNNSLPPVQQRDLPKYISLHGRSYCVRVPGHKRQSFSSSIDDPNEGLKQAKAYVASCV